MALFVVLVSQNRFFLSDSDDDNFHVGIAQKTEAELYLKEQNISKPEVGPLNFLVSFFFLMLIIF
jgi:hypothetical protein